MWGGDLYQYQIGKRNFKWRLTELLRRPAIKRMGNFVTYIKGDYELAKKWYGCAGRWHECLLYTSNVYKKNVIGERAADADDKTTILLGNSADPTNNHFAAFDVLETYKTRISNWSCRSPTAINAMRQKWWPKARGALARSLSP